MKKLISRVFYFYYDGFRGMTVGRKLWAIIVLKLIIMFLVLKLFFFPDLLKENFSTDQDRSNHVIMDLNNRNK